MSLSKAPGNWRWEHRSSGWWRINDVLRIEDGPHTLAERLLAEQATHSTLEEGEGE